ncbi:hypothetical protein SUDANB58_00149 [Streptomyces sp. enrichment culture]
MHEATRPRGPAVDHDAGAGPLAVSPQSLARVTKVRLEQARIIVAVDESAGRTAVRSPRIPEPGSVPVSEPVGTDPSLAGAPAGPLRTRGPRRTAATALPPHTRG